MAKKKHMTLMIMDSKIEDMACCTIAALAPDNTWSSFKVYVDIEEDEAHIRESAAEYARQFTQGWVDRGIRFACIEVTYPPHDQE